MHRKPKRKPDDPAQSKRFIETAKALGVDESTGAFERAFKRAVPPRRELAKRQPPKEEGE